MKGGMLLEEAMRALYPGSTDALDPNANGDGDQLIAINTSGYPRRDIVKIPLPAARALSDAAVQMSHDNAAYVLFENPGAAASVSTMSVQSLSAPSFVPARGETPVCCLIYGLRIDLVDDLQLALLPRASLSPMRCSRSQSRRRVASRACTT